MSGFSDVVQIVNPAPELDLVIASGSADVDQTVGVTTLAIVPKATLAQNTTVTIPDPGVAAAEFVLNGGTSAAITAFAGGGKASATALTASFNVVTVVATAADSVGLPLAVLGKQVVVANMDTTDALAVFPAAAGTDTINNLATTVAFSVPAVTTSIFLCVASAPAGRWVVVKGAA